MHWTTFEPYALATGGLLAGCCLTAALMAVCRRRSAAGAHVEPLLLNGRVVNGHQPTDTLASRRAQPAYLNVVFLIVFVATGLGAAAAAGYLLIAYFGLIWKSGFVAALLLGGIALALRKGVMWVHNNIVLRHFFTTMQLSRENKESTPVLEWFKVWLPRYMKQHNRQFHNVAPLFRKKDGTAFFTHFQDSRKSDQFTISLWAAQGTHRFDFVAADGSRSRVVMVYYTKGEAKKTGWNNELVAQEYIDLYLFDPLHTRLRHLLEMLERAQAAFGEKDASALRFQRWNDWKEMWESRGADEPIQSVESLVFYEPRLLRRVYEEVEAFLHTPAELLLRAGLPLKLGFLFHGPPGTGKTHLVRHLAARYALDIDIVDLNGGHMNNGALMSCVNMAAGILLLEDIDNVDAAIGVKHAAPRREPSAGRAAAPALCASRARAAGGRAGLDKDSKRVTLDGLLNALDGVQRGSHKRIIIATTNFPEKLVPSLRRRGRLGVSFEVSYPADGVLAKLVAHTLPRCDAKRAVGALRAVERRVGIRAPTAALTDVFCKAGLREADDAAAADAAAAGAVALVEEVLAEVAATNKKVFVTIDEVLGFLQLEDAWTDGDLGASGLVWEARAADGARADGDGAEGAPPTAPRYGRAPRELRHPRLSAALGEKASAASAAGGGAPSVLELTEEEWKALKAPPARLDRYVRAAGGWWAPRDEDDAAEPERGEKRPRTYAAAFARVGCSLCKHCKLLNDGQLKDEVGIAKVGHRMMLLEQFRFL